MFPAPFDYRRPDSVDAALAALAADGAVALAGGHSLVPEMKSRERTPDVIVDLGGLDALRGVDRDGDELVVGALTTYADFLAADPVGVDVLTDATRAVGDRQIRNRGTVGGNLAAAEPRGDLPAATVAADATLVVRDADGERPVGAEEFFRGDGETACGDDELLTAVRLPTAPAEEKRVEATRVSETTWFGGAYSKKTHPSEGYAAVGVAARVGVANGVVTGARVAVNGVLDRPTRLDAVESALIGLDVDAALEEGGANAEGPLAEAAARATEGIDPVDARSDHLVSGAYRVELLPTYTRHAVADALGRATGAAVDDGEVSA